MKKVLLLNGGKQFAHSDGRYNATLHETALSFLDRAACRRSGARRATVTDICVMPERLGCPSSETEFVLLPFSTLGADTLSF